MAERDLQVEVLQRRSPVFADEAEERALLLVELRRVEDEIDNPIGESPIAMAELRTGDGKLSMRVAIAGCGARR